jgi:carboxylesterase
MPPTDPVAPATPAAPAYTGDPAPFHFPGQRHVGVLLIHGWSGSPAEMRGMGQYLAAHGATVRGLRLPGHGTRPEDLFRTRWQDWAAACGQALADLRRDCDQVAVAGLSMGGLLTLYSAATHRPPVAAAVAMGAPVYFRDWRVSALPVLKRVVRWHTKGPSDIRDRDALARLWHYPRLPTHSIHQMSVLAAQVRRVLPQLRAPLLVMQGRHDKAIDPGCAAYIAAHTGSAEKQVIYWENSGHAITEDHEREAVWAAAWDFIREHTR